MNYIIDLIIGFIKKIEMTLLSLNEEIEDVYLIEIMIKWILKKKKQINHNHEVYLMIKQKKKKPNKQFFFLFDMNRWERTDDAEYSSA